MKKDKPSEYVKDIQAQIDIANSIGAKVNVLSDGYHSFNELYAYRKTYNALLFNEWAANKEHIVVSNKFTGGIGMKTISRPLYNVHKSKRHSDGELCFGGGYFVVIAELPTGQISNHYKLKYWDDFQVPVTKKALVEYDGHSSEEALERMEKFLKQQYDN